jgi:pseudaminic acid biosynthesis-associated methylase
MPVITTKRPKPPRKLIPPKPLHPTELWKGDFGDDYTIRNRPKWEDRIPFWQHILDRTNAQSFLEVGCNAGWNMRAIRSLNSEATMTGVDLNRKALEEAQGAGLDVEEVAGSEVERIFGPSCCEMSFTSGVLIHVHPDDLRATMLAIKNVSSQFVLSIEYESPEVQEVEYRGNTGALWKRPYGELYRAMGLSIVETGEAQGFDQCQYVLLERN